MTSLLWNLFDIFAEGIHKIKCKYGNNVKKKKKKKMINAELNTKIVIAILKALEMIY